MDSTHRTLKFYIYLGAVVTLGIAISLLKPQPVLAESLEQQVAAHTGLVRTVSPTLQAHAATRASEIACVGCFSHDLMRTYPEILAWSTDPSVDFVALWHASPDHEGFMHDANYDSIGCATTTGPAPDGGGDTATYAVCVFAPWYDRAPEPVPVPPAEVPYSPPVAPVPVIPNTAMNIDHALLPKPCHPAGPPQGMGAAGR